MKIVPLGRCLQLIIFPWQTAVFNYFLFYILDENSVFTKPSLLTLQKPVMEEAFAIPASQIYPASNLSLDFRSAPATLRLKDHP